ncbi:MAG: peptide deformylase [bacterium]
MAIRTILQLGNPDLHLISEKVSRSQLSELDAIVVDLRDTLLEFRRVHSRGRAIAAPQIGVAIRLVYVHLPQPTIMVNPSLDQMSGETLEIWDDCMSFPGLFVRVERHVSCRLSYRDRDWRRRTRLIKSSTAELLQHECDHLDGILATERAVDGRAFSLGILTPES